MFIQTVLTDPFYFFTVVGVVIVSVSLHEFSHALAALSQGDSTARDAGYLTLNPWVHMGPYSLLLLAVAGIAWGQTPVNPANFRHPWSGALVSVAGPVMNLLLMLACCLALLVLRGSADEATLTVLFMGALINAVLLLFNLIPIPPLDGYGVLETLVPPVRQYASVLHRYGFMVLLIGFFILPLGDVLFGAAHALVTEVLSMLGQI